MVVMNFADCLKWGNEREKNYHIDYYNPDICRLFCSLWIFDHWRIGISGIEDHCPDCANWPGDDFGA